MARIAFIGTGIMGKGMAHRILKAGHKLVVHNRNKAKADDLIHAGASFSGTPAMTVRDADCIISMVGDDDDSREVWLGDEGVIHGGIRNNTVAVECSTLSQAWILELNGKLAAAGIPFADCPVTGGPDGAYAGTLRVLAGAEPKTLEMVKPVLSAFARDIVHFGPVGSGTAYKLIVNLMGAVQAVALAEGLVLGEKCGLDLRQVGETLSEGTVASPHVQYLIKRMLNGDHDNVYFSTQWRYKDAAYALELAAGKNLHLPVSTNARDIYRLAVRQGLGHKNSSIIFDVIHDLCAGK